MGGSGDGGGKTRRASPLPPAGWNKAARKEVDINETGDELVVVLIALSFSPQLNRMPGVVVVGANPVPYFHVSSHSLSVLVSEQ